MAEVVVHPLYSPATTRADIGLVRLVEAADPASFPPACLPAQGEQFAGVQGWVAGGRGHHCTTPRVRGEEREQQHFG